MNKRRMLGLLGGLLGWTALAGPALAQEVMLRVHWATPEQAPIARFGLQEWVKKVEAQSAGRIKIQAFYGMSLGGTPAQLFDQVRDGVVDISATVLGYTPGRFVRTEVFELPFMTLAGEGAAQKTSKALWEYTEKNAMAELKEVRMLALFTAGPGVVHSRQAITKLEDMSGKKVRGGSRIVNSMLSQLGASPVGMPFTAIPEGLTKGMLDATLGPWELVPPLRLHDLVKTHTDFAGGRSLFNGVNAMFMNKASYEKLPADLKKVIDDNSGLEASALFGTAMDNGDKGGRGLTEKAGNKLIHLDAAETQRWMKATESVEKEWIADVAKKGIDGKKLVDEARALIAKQVK
jgi:TRAP-type transport system periplasmic protein